MKPVRPGRVPLGYVAVVATAFFVAMFFGWKTLATQIDGSAYDWVLQLRSADAWKPESVVVAIDEAALRDKRIGGVGQYRRMLAQALNAIGPVDPKSIAIDVVLVDEGDPAQNAELESALAISRNVVLAADIDPSGRAWEEPREGFRRYASAVGHVQTRENEPIARVLPLRKIAGHTRHWALALEAFRLYRGSRYIVESPEELEVGGTTIPLGRASDAGMYIRYLPPDAIPQISLMDLLSNPQQRERLRGKAVFIGVTALSAARDRLMTPLERQMSGIEINAQAFETMQHGQFLLPASNLSVFAFALLLATAAAITFLFLTGWRSYTIGTLLIALAHVAPHLALSRGIIFPLLFPVLAAWLCVVTAATWMHFVVRGQLRKSESDRARYQEAIHFVTHEMRSPLTAIQGSSEMMGRYNLNEEKRKQMAQMINSESKRLARMIQTFLDVERLSQGQMELRTETFEAESVISACMQRAQPLADRKQIRMTLDEVEQFPLVGDRELMEYAVYNLLTNAIKYSPAETTVTVRARQDGHMLRLAVADQGIGMDEKELKNIFKKFYRTKKAEKSGEVGTGIGLSIVEQIVTHHGGRIEVTSTPGKGSCFTMVLPRGVAPASVPASTLAST